MSRNKPSSVLDDEPFQKMLGGLCSNLHRVVRRGVVLLSDMDLLCQVVSVLREERATANASANTRAVARSISAMIEDAQERLIFCTLAVLTKEVVKFQPSPSDLDYPNKLLAKEKQAGSAESKLTAEDAVQAQMQVYESWFPPMRSVLRVLSKIFRVVEPRVFEDIAFQAVQSCTKSLKEAAGYVRAKEGEIDADLFLVKHLLVRCYMWRLATWRESCTQVENAQISRLFHFACLRVFDRYFVNSYHHLIFNYELLSVS